jgi:hypothetical protein
MIKIIKFSIINLQIIKIDYNKINYLIIYQFMPLSLCESVYSHVKNLLIQVFIKIFFKPVSCLILYNLIFLKSHKVIILKAQKS